jgi:hypothetical protein
LHISFFFRIFVAVKYIFKHIITCITLVCFLTATNGLSLVEHYCSSQEKSYIFLFTQDPDCEDHKCAPKAEEQTCCVHEHTTDCCQNISKFFKLVVDFFSTSHDIKNTTCPIFFVEHFSAENWCLPNCQCHFFCDFSEDVGLPERLLIKQTAELLL